MNTFFDQVMTAFHYGFIVKALIVGSLIGFSAAFIGVFLVLKKYSLIGDGLAHVSFATIAIALFFNSSPIWVSIPLVMGASVLITQLSKTANVNGDAAIGLISSTALAIGILISSVSKGFNIDLFSYLFGSILVIGDIDIYMSIVLSCIVLIVVIFNYHQLFAITYDEEFSKVIGLNAEATNTVLSLLTAVTVVLGIRVVGTMLISSLIIFPTVSALQISNGFKSTIVIAVVIAVLCVVVGVLLSFVLNFPTGATIVLLNALVFIILFGIRKLQRS